ncbi:muts domain V-domain-containing protein [Catenaria anguillulae PL171]|uniref:Muts domain V-domain-containing protein n=1 Tax=Catenaria anguillulae PL171 TaxID=765915 RepID=A0A1Y2HLF6_9FUNG|nr:muts domain V-domain-containing protein [Catenaria anguillulae PL171]
MSATSQPASSSQGRPTTAAPPDSFRQDSQDQDDSHTPPAPQILALHLDKSHLGFSLYDSLTSTLHVGSSDDVDLAPHHDRVHALLAMYLPSVVLVSARSPLASVIAQTESSVGIVVEERPAQDFVYVNARGKLADVVASQNRLPHNRPVVRNANTGKQVDVQLDALVGGDIKSNILSVCSAGALCRFLDALRSVKDKHLSQPVAAKRDPGAAHRWGTRSTLASTPTPQPPLSPHSAVFGATSTTLSRARAHPLAIDDPFLDTMSVAGTLRPPTTSASTMSADLPAVAYDFVIQRLELITPADTLHLPASTQAALQLFDTPGSLAPLATEFTCVMSVLDATRSADGKWRLRQWMARPLANAKEIARRLDAVEYLTKPESAGLVRAVRGQLVHVKPLGKMLSKHMLGPGEYKAVVGTMRAGVSIIEALTGVGAAGEQVQEEVPDMLRALVCVPGGRVDDLVQAATRTITLISQVIDFDSSTRDQRCVVHLGIDHQLDDLKRQFDELPSLLADIAADLAQLLPTQLATHVNVVYLPQIGYLVLLPRDALDAYLGPLAPLDTYAVPGLELQFSTPAYGYFKSPMMRDMDASLGDIYGMITDRELEIVFVVREAVRELEPLIRELHTHLVTLDVLVSLAEAATRFGYTRPTIETGDGAPLVASQVWHPLLERAGSTLGKPTRTYIPNAVALGTGGCRTYLLTGANGSGKSVYLKSVALLVYLAHIGSFVPAAQGARVPLTDAILSRMAACDSVSQLGSAFMHDVQQVAQIVRRATRSSLVLIDEFGKGTSVPDGIGLVAGVVEYLARGGTEAEAYVSESGSLGDAPEERTAPIGPLVIAATHFHDILTHNLLPPDLSIGTLATQILLHPSPTSTSPDLVFLYRVTESTTACVSSYAAHCASLAHVPPRIVRRGMLAAHAIEAQTHLARVDEEVSKECEHGLEVVVGEFLARELREQANGGVSELIDKVETAMNARVDCGVYEKLVDEEGENEEANDETIDG